MLAPNCPNAATIRRLFTSPDTAAATTWRTEVRDNATTPPLTCPSSGSTPSAFYSDASTAGQPPFDCNADGRVWARAEATVRGRRRAMIALVQAERETQPLPRSVLLAGRLEIGTNGNKLHIDAQADTALTTNIAVRCTPAALLDLSPPCLKVGQETGLLDNLWSATKLPIQLNGTMPQTGYPPARVLSPDALERLRRTAITNGTYFETCPTDASKLAGAVVDVETCSQTYNSTSVINTPESPGALIIADGTITLKGNITYHGMLYHANLSNATGILVDSRSMAPGFCESTARPSRPCAPTALPASSRTPGARSRRASLWAGRPLDDRLDSAADPSALNAGVAHADEMSVTVTTSLFAALLGSVMGSFLNVVSHRLPRRESLVHPPSRCSGCGADVKPYDNVPIFSWLILRGRCRSCAAPISARYPLVEAVTAGLYVACVARFGLGLEVILPLVFVTLLVPVAAIDLEHRIIPNVLVGPAAVVAVAVAALLLDDSLPERLIAGAVAGGFLLMAALAYPAGMGMGDVKLAGVMGLFLGRAVGPAIFVALIAGTVVGVAIMARRGVAQGRKTAVPFGPFLVLGSLVGLFAGEAIVDWYVDSFVA
ncbi:MAG TPA: prepilin peptidase [Solirubrobacteraceae bacterium]|nr:prepilin peptidase [Solirubrobacteraceae bacterium]